MFLQVNHTWRKCQHWRWSHRNDYCECIVDLEVSFLNPKGTQTVPLVYVRQVSKNAYGQMGAHDFLDGANAGAQYFDAVHRLAMTSADQNHVL